VGLVGEEERSGAGEAAVVAEPFREAVELVEGFDAELIGTGGGGLPHDFRELDQGLIDLVLEEAGGGGGGAARNVAAIEQRALDTGPGEVVCGHGPGDAAPEDGDAGAEVAVKGRGVRGVIPVFLGPVEAAGAEVHR
jgi:hypothetical protein